MTNTALHKAPAAVRITKARTALLLDHPFFGALLFRLGGRPCSSIETMATDGVSLFYNPAFVDRLSASDLAGVLAHEVMHPALKHHTRRAGREPGRWNMACDYAINPMLVDAGLSLPAGVLNEARFRGMNAEVIYNLLDDQRQSHGQQSQAQEGSSQDVEDKQDSAKGPAAPSTPGGFGQVLDAPEPVKEAGGAAARTDAEQERDWSIAVEQASSVARRAGKLPGGVARGIEQAKAAGVDWRELLRRAWSDLCPADYSWTPPNRRHVWSGLYLPGLAREGVGEVAIAVDCSGSVRARQLGLFEAEIRSIFEAERPSRVHVLYFDTAVNRADLYQAGEPIALTPAGGGGTDFTPCFTWLEEHGVTPQALIVFTDLCGSFPEQEPGYPVLWAATSGRRAPFGTVVPMQAA